MKRMETKVSEKTYNAFVKKAQKNGLTIQAAISQLITNYLKK